MAGEWQAVLGVTAAAVMAQQVSRDRGERGTAAASRAGRVEGRQG